MPNASNVSSSIGRRGPASPARSVRRRFIRRRIASVGLRSSQASIVPPLPWPTCPGVLDPRARADLILRLPLGHQQDRALDFALTVAQRRERDAAEDRLAPPVGRLQV